MRVRNLLASATFLAAAPLAAAEPVSLDDAIALALAHDPAIDQAQAGLERSRAGIDAARAQKGLQAGLKAEVGALETDFTTDRISQVPRSAGLQAEWPVYASGALDAAVNAASFQREAAEKQLLGARERIVLDTFEAYARTWLAEQTVKVAEARVGTFRIRLDETNARLEQGQVTRTDTALTEARLASAEAQLEAARAALSATRARLSRLTGVADAKPLGPALMLNEPFGSEKEVLVEVLRSNTDLAAAQAAARSASSRVDQARGQFGPKVSLRARATTGEDIYFFFEDQISDVGAFVTVEVPLFTSGLKSASEREALAGRSAAQAGVRQVRLELEQAVSGLWGDIEARRLAVEAATRAETAASLAAEGAQKEYEAGLRTLVDALDAENAYRDAQIAKLQAETQLKIAEARLLSLSSDLESTLVR